MTREFPLTGYRDHNDKKGQNNREAAVEFLANLKSIPKDADGKFNVYLLNDLPVPEGSAAPVEMFRRGLLEVGATSFLNNSYPEWIGDATDDADADLDSLMYIRSLTEYGYERLNDDLNTAPVRNQWGFDDYPEGNILFLSNAAITDELLTLMKGRDND